MSRPITPPAPPPPAPPSEQRLPSKGANARMLAPTFPDGTLVLYMHPYNFYSVKVLLILYEKNITVHTYTVDMANGEQYSPWFLSLNPNGNVPVLQDGAFVVPDSRNIITYVENKFRGNYYPLFPRDINSKEYERIQFYDRVFTKLPVGALSLGSFVHEDLQLNPKLPFIGLIRKSCLENNAKVYDILKRSIDVADTNKEALLDKLDLQDRRMRLVVSRVDFQKVLDETQNVLRYIEKDLQQNPSREWLVSNEYSMADVSLGLLLHRLYQLGYENYYWTNGKLPLIAAYLKRFRQREAFQRIVPNNFGILKDIWEKTPNNYKLGASAGVVGMAMFAAFAHK